MKVTWTSLAYQTYDDEIDFIILKWSQYEAVKLINKVVEFEKLVVENTALGRKFNSKGHRVFVLSKQTSIIYKVEKDLNLIIISLVWNNTKNPQSLNKLLR